jgi:threonine-phosphate decarboxylase
VVGKHGGNIYQVARRKGLKPENIIDFSANINPLGYSSRVKNVLASSENAILNYPDPIAYDFINALSSFHNLPAENFLVGNGSTEFIYLLPGIIRPKSVLVVAPTFTEYKYSFQQAKGVLFYYNTLEKDHFVIQQKKLFDELKRGYSALYICNPANPTGVLVPEGTMKEIIGYACKKGTSVILDETFMDFTEQHSLKAQIKNFDNLYILRSMTKFFALPGLRAGYLISNGKNIEKIIKRQEPWSMNAIAQQAGIESLKDHAHMQKSILYVRETREAFVKELTKLPYLTVFKGSANFLLLKLNESAPVTVSGLYEKLLDKGIVIRTCEDFQGLSDMFFRIAVKKKNENKKLVSELKRLLI